MTKSFCLLALTPLAFAGCASEPVVTTTSTEVRQEVVQTQGDRVVAREVTVTRTPPAIRLETQTRSPGAQYVWTAWLLALDWDSTSGCQAAGCCGQSQQLCGLRASGSVGRVAGCLLLVIGNNDITCQKNCARGLAEIA